MEVLKAAGAVCWPLDEVRATPGHGQLPTVNTETRRLGHLDVSHLLEVAEISWSFPSFDCLSTRSRRQARAHALGQRPAMLSWLSYVSATTAAALSTPSVVYTPPDAKLKQISIGTSDLQTQGLPISMCQSWPVWMATADGKAVTRLPDASDADDGGWCDAATFEQLWQPVDLPQPQFTAALGAVLKNGAPRYLFPCVESTITTIGGALDGQVWHNRGLNSLPLAKTWLIFGDIPADSLRLSAYVAPLPPPPPETAEGEGEEGDQAAAEAAEVAARAAEAAEAASALWQPVLPLTEVQSSLDALFEIIGNAPDELGDGWHYLVAPLSGDGARLSADDVGPGKRLRLFLSDVDATPTALDPEERDSWVWKRGEADLAIYNVGPGGESEFLPEAYKPLFDAK